jgi:hypothetical protein
MAAPGSGASAHTDDEAVLSHERLLRRIHPKWKVPDYNSHRWRVSSAAYDDSEDGSPTSVSLEQTLIQQGLPITLPLQGHEGYTLAAVTMGFARTVQQGIQRDPQPNDPSHALLFGTKTKSVRRKLAENSEWIVAPQEPLPDEKS